MNTEEKGIDLKLWFPLIEWGKSRQDLKTEINEVGYCASKSSCFYCPAMSYGEVRQLQKHYPDLYDRAIAIEDGAELNNTKGLGRSWSWKKAMSQGELFDLEDYEGVNTCGCLNW